MFTSVTGVTGSVLSFALDGLAARQNQIAHNVANLDTPGFTAQAVSFESALAAAYGDALSAGEDSVSGVPFTTQDADTPVGLNGNNVDLRKEALASVQTQITYQVAARAASDQFDLLRFAVG